MSVLSIMMKRRQEKLKQNYAVALSEITICRYGSTMNRNFRTMPVSYLRITRFYDGTNAPHYPNISTAPHHFHDENNKVSKSPLKGKMQQDLKTVLSEIEKWLTSENGSKI